MMVVKSDDRLAEKKVVMSVELMGLMKVLMMVVMKEKQTAEAMVGM